MKVNVTIPVYNEEKVIEKSIFTLSCVLKKKFHKYKLGNINCRL